MNPIIQVTMSLVPCHLRMETDNSIESQIAYQDTIKAGHV